MSLLLEEAAESISESGEGVEMYCPDSDELEESECSSVPVEVVGQYTWKNEKLNRLGSDERSLLPLHEMDSGELTGEYLEYKEGDHNSFVFYSTGSGGSTFLDVEKFGKTRLARRTRFWHSDYVPSKTPSYFNRMLSEEEEPQNPVDREEFFGGILEYIEKERREQIRENRDRYEGKTAREIHEGGEDAVPCLSYHGRTKTGLHRFKVDTDREPEGDE